MDLVGVVPIDSEGDMPQRHSTPSSRTVTPAIVLSCRRKIVGQVFDPRPIALEPPLQA